MKEDGYIMIKDYKIFENLQQAENWVNNPPKNKSERKWVNFLMLYPQLKEHLKSIGKLGYLYLFTRLLYRMVTIHEKDNKPILDHMIKYIDLIVKHNIKIDIKKYLDQINRNCCYLFDNISRDIKIIETNKFIDKWAPGFLKKELKDKRDGGYFNKLLALLHYGRWGPNNLIDDIDISLLRGKMSMFKDPQEWIDYVKNTTFSTPEGNISKLKESDDIKIYYEDDEWLIYQPFTYESMNIIKYPGWCTVVKYQYDSHIKQRYFWIILFNKKSKDKSLIAQFQDLPIEWNRRRNRTLVIYNYDGHFICNTQFQDLPIEDFEKLIKKNSSWLNRKILTDSERKIMKNFFELKDEFKNEIKKIK